MTTIKIWREKKIRQKRRHEKRKRFEEFMLRNMCSGYRVHMSNIHAPVLSPPVSEWISYIESSQKLRGKKAATNTVVSGCTHHLIRFIYTHAFIKYYCTVFFCACLKCWQAPGAFSFGRACFFSLSQFSVVSSTSQFFGLFCCTASQDDEGDEVQRRTKNT